MNNASCFGANRQDTPQLIDGGFTHPFTCLVVGPSGCGKTTFVRKLLGDVSGHINGAPFSHITIFLGTEVEENKDFCEFANENQMDNIDLVNLKTMYQTQKEFEDKFHQDFVKIIREKGPGGCVVFDDLMVELSRANILTEMFSKHSSKLKLSVIHITQNMFFKGKNPQEHVTVYNNAHHIVLFKYPLDNTPVTCLARRITGGATNEYKATVKLMKHVTGRYRYVIVSGGFSERDSSLQFTTDIFNTSPIRFMRVFSLNI